MVTPNVSSTKAISLKIASESTRPSPMMSVSGATGVAPSRPVRSRAQNLARVWNYCGSG
jgi:hypothetical protein